MNTDSFERKYGHYGGIKQLAKMRNSFFPLKTIALHFKVSQERVRQWMLEIFGSSYDPRPDRRNEAIKKMVKFYFNHSKEEFDKKFKGTAYYQEALKTINEIIV